MLTNTCAGGVNVDDVILQPFMQDLAFGGEGEGDMGRHWGFDGFKSFSYGERIEQRLWLDVSRFLALPYSGALTRMMRRVFRFG